MRRDLPSGTVTFRDPGVRGREARGVGGCGRHADFFLALAEEGTVIVMDATWVDRLDIEVDNVRGALDFAAATGESQRVLRATASLRDFWFTRGYIAEGRTRLESALVADPEPSSARCIALIAASAAATVAGAMAPARRPSTRASRLPTRSETRT